MPKLKPVAYLVLGLLLGLLLFAAVRWFGYRDESVHYHANFAVYINGAREQFSSPGYYQEVLSCDANASANPLHRAHMHDSVNDVAHVEDQGVTWGQFFENLGWSVSGLALKNTNTIYVDGRGGELTFILNEVRQEDVASRVIQSRDKLLVSYGAAPQAETEYQSVADSAATFNSQDDPAACAGQDQSGWRARWHHLWF